MPQCSSCKTQSDFIYVGIIHVECITKDCKNFNKKVYEAWQAFRKTEQNINTSESDEVDNETLDMYASHYNKYIPDIALD